MLSTIRQGATGADARVARLMLGLTDGEVFDAAAVARTLTFQREHGLTPDGVIGPKTWAALIASPGAETASPGGETAAPEGTNPAVTTPFGQPIDYKQGASPWGKKIYSSTGNKSQTYANSGCGPTAAADIVASMIDKTVTPETLGILAVANGYRTKNNGTAWAFFRFIANRFGFSKFAQTLSRATLKAALDGGALAVASMAPGYWTSGGHFVCVWKDDGTTIYANDPASSKRTKQDGNQFMKELKQLFIFWP